MSTKRLIALAITVPVMTVASLSGVSQAANSSTPTTSQVQIATSTEQLPAFVPQVPTGDAATATPQIWKAAAANFGKGLVAGAVGAAVAAAVVASKATSDPVSPADVGPVLGDAEFDAVS